MSPKEALKTIVVNVSFIMVLCIYYLSTSGRDGVMITTLNIFVPIAVFSLLIYTDLVILRPVFSKPNQSLKRRLLKMRRSREAKALAMLALKTLDDFEERLGVFHSLMDRYFKEDENMGNFVSLSEDLHDAVVSNTEKIAIRLETCDAGELRGTCTDITNAGNTETGREISILGRQNKEIILNFNRLIDEIIRLQESSNENDLNYLKDMVHSMRSLRLGDE